MRSGRWFAAGGLLLGAAAGAAAMHWWMERPETTVSRFHKLYAARGAQTYNNTYWLGVPAQKTPLDMWVFQELIHRVRPDVIVETGTYKGGSAYYFASICGLAGRGRVITVDVEDYPGRPRHERITYLHGSSTAPETVEKIKRMIAPGEVVMVFLDSDHSAAHVREELRLYSPLVTAGSYLIVEDTHFNGHPILPKHGPGPWEAVEEFLRGAPEFTPDRGQEKFLLTFNPRGFLRRGH